MADHTAVKFKPCLAKKDHCPVVQINLFHGDSINYLKIPSKFSFASIYIFVISTYILQQVDTQDIKFMKDGKT